MAKFFGVIGYGTTEETAPGVHENLVVEKEYYGEVLRNSKSLENGDKVNNDISVGNSISIVSDAYTEDPMFSMLYVSWLGSLWMISKVTVQAPRLVLDLGGVYNGPTPIAAPVVS